MNGIVGVINKEAGLATKQLAKMLNYDKQRKTEGIVSFINEKENCGLGKWGAKKKHSSIKEGLSIVFSGSVHNVAELQSIFIEKGIDCTELSTDEIVLNAYLIWGNDVPLHLNGEFVFAIWDEQNATLSLFRDRLGLKSIYYYATESAFYFSTQLNALKPFIDKQDWSEPAIHYFFRFGYIPAPFTIYKGVKKLEEGSYLQLNFDVYFNISDGSIDLKPVQYWKLEEEIQKETITDEVKAKKELHDLLKSSVEMRMRGEESVGVLLSGGVDSSLMAAITQSFSKEPIPTFSIGFKESSHNESDYANQVAEQLGTDHHEFILSHQEARELIRNLPDWYEQPYADSSALPTYLVSRKAKQKVDKVLLGDGGDEQFMGYGMYTWADRLNTFTNSKVFFKTLLKLSPKMNHKRASQYFDYTDKDHVPSHIFSVEQGFFTAKGINKNFCFKEESPVFQIDKTARKLFVSERQSLFDLKYYLPGDLAEKVDRVATSLDLLAAAPILDYRIVEWSLNLNESLKRKEGVQKYLLKEILYNYLPSSLFQRPKWGFGIPLGAWLSKELKPLLDEYVNEEKLNQYSFYNTAEILSIKKAFLEGKTYLYQQLWLVIMFNLWAERQE